MIAISHAGRWNRTAFWSVGAVAALSVHLALAAIVMAQLSEPDDDEDLGAPGIEIAFEVASPQRPPTDLPIGAESEASAASSAVAEQKESKQTIEQPPLPRSDDAELASVQNPERTEEKEQEQTASIVKPAEQSAAQEAAAPVAIQRPAVAVRSTAVEQGDTQAMRRARVTWQKALLAHLSKHKRYPAERVGKTAEIVVSMRLDRAGRVVSATIARSSGDEAFDRAALGMVERASPVPAPPPSVADQGLEFSLPVIFRRKGG